MFSPKDWVVNHYQIVLLLLVMKKWHFFEKNDWMTIIRSGNRWQLNIYGKSGYTVLFDITSFMLFDFIGFKATRVWKSNIVLISNLQPTPFKQDRVFWVLLVYLLKGSMKKGTIPSFSFVDFCKISVKIWQLMSKLIVPLWLLHVYHLRPLLISSCP